MTIRKRTGLTAPYEPEKIKRAILAAFSSLSEPVDATQAETTATTVMENITPEVIRRADAGNPMGVEEIQDRVEEGLIALRQHQVVRHFILYRTKHAEFRTQLAQFSALFPDSASPIATACLGEIRRIQRDWDESLYPAMQLLHKFTSFRKAGMTEAETLKSLIRAALELTSKETPDWEFAASALLSIQLRAELSAERLRLDIHSYPQLVRQLVADSLYGSYLLEHYTQADLEALQPVMDPERDRLLTYSGLDLLLKRYLVKTGDGRLLESPQEMFLGIAMHLAIPEGENRVYWAKRFYDMLSRLQVTMATPTMSNARKPHHQLSSCFIDTVPDSLDGIYRSITNFSQVSKFGGGMGLYFGKVRAVGSDIRGFKGAAGGVLRWIKLANDTAVAVDQLGVRQGAVAVYLDAWHRDLPEFLQLKTNNGDDRLKAHDVFPAVCWPDLFWKLAKENMDASWYLMCPHEIRKAMGWSLEDSFGEEWERRYQLCVAEPSIEKREIPVRDVVRMVIKSAVETGTPFAFFRDTVNRANPNAHKGIIYASNLCTEIAQYMSAIESVSQEIVEAEGETLIVTKTQAGDFVVCNLASLVLGNLVGGPTRKVGTSVFTGADKPSSVLLDTSLFTSAPSASATSTMGATVGILPKIATEPALFKPLEDVIPSLVRALDNVLAMNDYPVPYARITNQKYRPIGIGSSGYHHLLVKLGIRWESPEHLAFADMLYERINRIAVQASSDLAAEKGAYPYFEGSDWHTGAYFDKRGYNSPEWEAVRRDVTEKGMRNGYLMAIAPTGTTSVIAGTTAAVDPVMNRYFLEEKKGIIVPRVAPDLTPETFWLYKSAHSMDQSWVIDAAAARQRHIDQAQSVNLFITPEFTMRQVMALYLRAWEKGVKTLYYVRSQALEVEECDVCSA